MKIGHKIRKLRELKGWSQENMADELKMSINGYSKIERNEVDVALNKLEVIAEKLGLRPEDVITFDEKHIFNFYNNSVNGKDCTFNYTMSENERALYEKNAQLLEEKIKLLEQKIQFLEGK